jgi:plasmid stability protein
MSQIIVRNLELSLIRKLKKRAAAHGVSSEEEHRRILRKALSEPDEDFPDLKGVLLAMPDVGEDDDFARLREVAVRTRGGVSQRPRKRERQETLVESLVIGRACE